MKSIFTILFILTTNLLFAQSKKEQLELKQTKIDSLIYAGQAQKKEIENLRFEIISFQINYQKELDQHNSNYHLTKDSLSQVIENLNSMLVELTQKFDSLSKASSTDLLIQDELFYGDWGAYSKGYWGNGAFNITNGQLTFENFGNVNYEIINYNGKEYLLKLNKDIDGNNHFYVKLGLIYYEGESTTYMEVAFYETEKDGLNDMIKKRYIDADDHDWKFQSWGLYDKY